MKTLNRLAVCLVFLLPCSVLGNAPPDDAALVVQWNLRLLVNAEADDRFLTLKGVRAATMMHLAMHDAINMIDPRFRTYASNADGRGADPIAAATQAAFIVAVHEYPGHRDDWEKLRRAWLKWATNAKSREAGLHLGERAAEAVLARRAGDRWDGEAEYSFHPMAPGVYAEFAEHSGTPQGFVFGAGWAAAKPFALRSPSQFRSPRPPDIRSAEYTRAFDEVRSVGRFGSRTRTADQTHLAYWWKDFAENSHNRLARRLVTDERPDLWTAARLFALINVSIVDAYIGVFDNKFFYNHWRPYTAIRWAAHDGNPRTRAEPDWNNTHQHTYAFPSYPSAHGTACAAAMTVFADTFGDRRWFVMSTPQVDAAGPLSQKIPMKPATRSFDSFSEAARECAWSRVYLGIHFRYDSLEGNRLGKRIGEYVVRTLLQPLGPWRRAAIDDVTLEYQVVGRGEPVVFIHGGLFADALDVLARVPALSGGRRVVTWRRVGYGGSGPAEGHSSIAAQAEQLAGLMRHLGIRRAHVIGHSSGGLIALQLALDQPQAVRSLVLLESAIPIAGAVSPGIAEAVERYGRGDHHGAVDAFMRAVAGPDWRRQAGRQLSMAHAFTAVPAFFEYELPAVREWTLGEDAPSRIRVPALAVIGGGSDDVSPIWRQRHDFLLAHLPRVESAELAGARHLMAVTHAQELAHRLDVFFREASRGAPGKLIRKIDLSPFSRGAPGK